MPQGPSLPPGASTGPINPTPDAKEAPQKAQSGNWGGRTISPAANAVRQTPADDAAKAQGEESNGLAGRTRKLEKSDIVQLHRIGDDRLEEYNSSLYEQQFQLCETKMAGLRNKAGYTALHQRGEGGAGIAQGVLRGVDDSIAVEKIMAATEANGREVLFLERFSHDNIVSVRNTSLEKTTDDQGQVVEQLHLVMDDGGHSLDRLIDDNKLSALARRFDTGAGALSADRIATMLMKTPDPDDPEAALSPQEQAQVDYWRNEMGKMVVLARDPTQPATGDNRLVFNPLPMELIQSSIKQAGNALDYLHNTQDVVHCDLKPGNLLTTADGHVRLCDFGLAADLGNLPEEAQAFFWDDRGGPYLNLATITESTLNYSPPEVFAARLSGLEEVPAEQPYAIDSWALGCCLYEMVFGEILFEPGYFGGSKEERMEQEARAMLDMQQDTALLEQVIDTRIAALQSQLEDYLPQEQAAQLKELLMGLLTTDPADRMTIAEALDNPFLQEAPDRPFVRQNPTDNE